MLNISDYLFELCDIKVTYGLKHMLIANDKLYIFTVRDYEVLILSKDGIKTIILEDIPAPHIVGNDSNGIIHIFGLEDNHETVSVSHFNTINDTIMATYTAKNNKIAEIFRNDSNPWIVVDNKIYKLYASYLTVLCLKTYNVEKIVHDIENYELFAETLCYNGANLIYMAGHHDENREYYILEHNIETKKTRRLTTNKFNARENNFLIDPVIYCHDGILYVYDRYNTMEYLSYDTVNCKWNSHAMTTKFRVEDNIIGDGYFSYIIRYEKHRPPLYPIKSEIQRTFLVKLPSPTKTIIKNIPTCYNDMTINTVE